MPVGRISRSISKISRAEQGLDVFDASKAGAWGSFGWSALNFPDCVVWHKASTIPLNYGAPIPHSSDILGNMSVTQVTGSARPVYGVSAGKPCMIFDGVQQFISTWDPVNTVSLNKIVVPDVTTAYLVFRNLNTNDATRHAMANIGFASTKIAMSVEWATGTYGLGGANYGELTGGTPDVGTKHIMCGVVNGASSILGIDGQEFTGTTTVNVGASELHFGARYLPNLFWKGEIYEFILYTGAHNNVTRSLIYKALGAEHTIPVR